MSDEDSLPPATSPHLESDENALTSHENVPQNDEHSSHLIGDRLKKDFQCIVCKDVPHPNSIRQCPCGHIMCETCILHLCADATLHQCSARCPHCRNQFDFKDVKSNLPLKQAMWELPIDCRQCKQTFEFKNIERHKHEECPEREVDCKYSCIGCKWVGAFNAKGAHEAECVYPKKSALEILIEVEAKDKEAMLANRDLQLFYDQLSVLRSFNVDLEFRLHRSSNMDHITFDSQRFNAFELSWSIRVRVNENADERNMSYSLVLFTEPRAEIKVHYFLTKTQKVPLHIGTHVYKHVFNSTFRTSAFENMHLADTNECNRLLSLKSMWVRLWMFLN